MKGWLPNRSTRFIYKFIYFLAFWFFRLVYRHRVYGVENFYPGAAILAANHVSFLDPPILAISSPQEVHFLARHSLFKGLFGKLIHNLNAHPISGKAQDVTVFKTILKVLKGGGKVIIFPEGKRSADGQMQVIKPGISMLITRTRGAVIPAYIHGPYQIWPSHQKLPKLRGKTACVFGSPIFLEEEDGHEKKALQDGIASKLEKAILELKAWFEAGAQGTPP